ncbi:hypothetical protein NFI96_019343, partial [Prochilodus magdalenae]
MNYECIALLLLNCGEKVDACEAVTNDITKVVFERLTGVNGDFDAEYEGRRLRELLAPDYAHSIYSSTASESSASQLSGSSCIAAKRADAAAELAAKEAEYKVLLEERRQKEKDKNFGGATQEGVGNAEVRIRALKSRKGLKGSSCQTEKSISTSDKLHYLKRYVSGPAYKCVEGTFYRDDEEAYKDAWNKLNQRVTVKELPAVTPTDALKILESDFRDTPKNDKTVSQEDLIFLDKLKENIRRNEHGHYEMPLPFKERPCLPDNKQLAALRLNHLKQKFIANGKYKHDYIAYMKDLIEKVDVEEVHDDGANGETWYIPHHGIYHPKKPEKLRVVFDCSAKYKGTSLNEHLLPGPDMINNLTGVLIRFREHRIALMCDIEKMFHQFHVQENDRNYLRFLWWKNGDVNTPPHEFRMKVHLFGAVSSPGCANYGLKQLAKEHSLTHPQAAQFIARDFYVDDGVSSFESEEEAIQLAKEARELCAKGGLRLHKFVSNNSAVLQSIPSSEHATDIKTKNLTFSDLTLERALGIHWNIEKDSFTFKVVPKDQPATRRSILSSVASIYDPLGFVAPYLLNGKRILQEMCHQGTGWDDPLPDQLRPRPEKWQREVSELEKICIARCYLPADFGKVIKMELHHFSDASTSGYGQCSYLRLKNEKGEIHCVLVMGKARVSPMKVTTIPRLELTAAAVSVSVSSLLREELSYSQVEEFFWTDSKVVLGYINNDARRFHTFVANRVQKIRQGSSPKQWFYVSTDENPADNASRGTSIDELLSSNWFTGPQFLWEMEIETPVEVIQELPVGDPEVRKAQTLQTKTTEHLSLVDRLSKFSSWSRVIQAVARLVRRVRGDKSKALST